MGFWRGFCPWGQPRPKQVAHATLPRFGPRRHRALSQKTDVMSSSADLRFLKSFQLASRAFVALEPWGRTADESPSVNAHVVGGRIQRQLFSREWGHVERKPHTRLPTAGPRGPCDIPKCAEAVAGTGQASSPASDRRGQCSGFGITGLMVSFGWAVGCPDRWLNVIWGVSVKAFLKETFELAD